jgi:uncharacterized membrane protein
MHSQLNHLIARQQTAELAQNAERARLAAASALSAPARRGGPIARLLARRRPTLAQMPPNGCADAAVR